MTRNSLFSHHDSSTITQPTTSTTSSSDLRKSQNLTDHEYSTRGWGSGPLLPTPSSGGPGSLNSPLRSYKIFQFRLKINNCWQWTSDACLPVNSVAVPRFRLNTYGRRAFSVAGPTVCMELSPGFSSATDEGNGKGKGKSVDLYSA